MSKIDHVVIVVQENHTFDTYFGQYCTGATGSAPTCTTGPSCCEAGPLMEPSGASPMVLDDAANGAFDPDHTQACELAEEDGGLMDHYVTGAGTCSDARHFAYADSSTMATYWGYAQTGAIADRYFQPVAGQSASNDIYLVRARFEFLDNAYEPDAIGSQCALVTTTTKFTDPMIGDLLNSAGVSWSFYAEGYQAMVDAQKDNTCPRAPTGCPFGLGLYPCTFDPDDVPSDFFAAGNDNPKTLRDYSQFADDLANASLPQVVYIRSAGYKSEHPGYGSTISDGATFVKGVVDAVQASDYAPDTLVLVTWDEGGGYFDHIAPPSAPTIDGQPYGTRIPLIAIGPHARANEVSHVTMEHSSIVKFIEWNWLGGVTGQLGGRDTTIANLGSLLDPALGVPEN
ncbi:MAG: alkaline phosphatase family protein [Kofleriaceae bacterium]